MSLRDAIRRRRHRHPLMEAWPCDICADIRPDELIGVHSIDVGPPEYLTEVRVNVKFCKDRETCQRLARDKARAMIDRWRTR